MTRCELTPRAHTRREQGSPQDGFEYLRRVRWQASTIPDVVTAPDVGQRVFEDHRTAYVPRTPGFQAAPPGAEVCCLLVGRGCGSVCGCLTAVRLALR